MNQQIKPSKRAGVAVRTQARIGVSVRVDAIQPKINLLDRAVFVVLDVLQKPTDAVYAWVSARTKGVA